MTNTNCAAEFSNARFSVCLSVFGGESVVSVFRVVNGEADMDQEEYFRTFSDPKLAAQAYVAVEAEARAHRFGGGRLNDKLLAMNAFRFVTRHIK